MLDARELGEEAVLAALMGISEMMGDLTDLDELLDAIVRIAPRLAAVDRCAIFLRNRRGAEFRAAHAFSPDPATTNRLMRLAIPEADIGKLAHKLVNQRIPVMFRVGREPLLPVPIIEAFDVRSMLLVPLVYQEQVMGFITLDEAGRDHLFTSREVNVVQAIATHAAVAIVHTRLAEAYRLERRRSEALADAMCDGVVTLDRQLRVV
ncbi:MAG: GAF domain-containing protein, partial [Candidatus Thermoplasmatota archaeon]